MRIRHTVMTLGLIGGLVVAPAAIAAEETPDSTPSPTVSPSASPTSEPTPVATDIPTAIPTQGPTDEPTVEPSASPEPSVAPTPEPTPAPTSEPTSEPTVAPSPVPTAEPTVETPVAPVPVPTEAPVPPIAEPTADPTGIAQVAPTSAPTGQPTENASSNSQIIDAAAASHAEDSETAAAAAQADNLVPVSSLSNVVNSLTDRESPSASATDSPSEEGNEPDSVLGLFNASQQGHNQDYQGTSDWIEGFLNAERPSSIASSNEAAGVVGAEIQGHRAEAATGGNIFQRGIVVMNGAKPLLIFTGIAALCLTFILGNFIYQSRPTSKGKK